MQLHIEFSFEIYCYPRAEHSARHLPHQVDHVDQEPWRLCLISYGGTPSLSVFHFFLRTHDGLMVEEVTTELQSVQQLLVAADAELLKPLWYKFLSSGQKLKRERNRIQHTDIHFKHNSIRIGVHFRSRTQVNEWIIMKNQLNFDNRISVLPHH